MKSEVEKTAMRKRPQTSAQAETCKDFPVTKEAKCPLVAGIELTTGIADLGQNARMEVQAN